MIYEITKNKLYNSALFVINSELNKVTIKNYKNYVITIEYDVMNFKYTSGKILLSLEKKNNHINLLRISGEFIQEILDIFHGLLNQKEVVELITTSVNNKFPALNFQEVRIN